MTFGSLFCGIGGIDLGLERAGLTCNWQVEHDEYALRVIEKRWPATPRYRDVRYFLGSKRWRRVREAWAVDLICGGFPCQDISNAGQRAGIEGERSGLWMEYARTINLLRPSLVLVENVPALNLRGLNRVLGDLALLGYDAEWDRIPAVAVGAPHLRWRIFIVAYANGREQGWRKQPVARSHRRDTQPAGDGPQGNASDAEGPGAGPVHAGQRDQGPGAADADGSGGPRLIADAGRELLEGLDPRHGNGRRRPTVGGSTAGTPADANRIERDPERELRPGQSDAGGGRQGTVPHAHRVRRKRREALLARGRQSVPERSRAVPLPFTESRWSGQLWREQFKAFCQAQRDLYWPDTQPPVCGVDDGVPHRVDRLKCLGNAVLSQLAEWIGTCLINYQRDHQ